MGVEIPVSFEAEKGGSSTRDGRGASQAGGGELCLRNPLHPVSILLHLGYFFSAGKFKTNPHFLTRSRRAAGRVLTPTPPLLPSSAPYFIYFFGAIDMISLFFFLPLAHFKPELPRLSLTSFKVPKIRRGREAVKPQPLLFSGRDQEGNSPHPRCRSTASSRCVFHWICFPGSKP